MKLSKSKTIFIQIQFKPWIAMSNLSDFSVSADTSAIFSDKTPINLPASHRFFELSQALAAYHGLDVVPTDISRQKAHGQRLPDACVLLVLTDEPSPRLLLTRRASNLSSHAGEVSLVGGKRDGTDISSLAVALREAYEEVGLPTDKTELLGYLPMQISKKGLLVRPVVVSIKPELVDVLTPSEHEIQTLFWASLTHLITNAPTEYVISNYLPNKAQKLYTPAWHINNALGDSEVVWGLTGRILASLLQIAFGVHYPWYYRIK